MCRNIQEKMTPRIHREREREKRERREREERDEVYMGMVLTPVSCTRS